MGKNEVIRRLKDHLSYCIRHHGVVKSTDEEYCIRYIKDFLFIDRKEAKEFYEQHLI